MSYEFMTISYCYQIKLSVDCGIYIYITTYNIFCPKTIFIMISISRVLIDFTQQIVAHNTHYTQPVCANTSERI